MRNESNIHHTKTCTLDPDLKYTQQASKARDAGDFPATGHILSTSWEDQDIRKRRRSRRCSQQDEVRRYSERAPQLDDTDVLGEVRYEDPKKDETFGTVSVLFVVDKEQLSYTVRLTEIGRS